MAFVKTKFGLCNPKFGLYFSKLGFSDKQRKRERKKQRKRERKRKGRRMGKGLGFGCKICDGASCGGASAGSEKVKKKEKSVEVVGI